MPHSTPPSPPMRAPARMGLQYELEQRQGEWKERIAGLNKAMMVSVGNQTSFLQLYGAADALRTVVEEVDVMLANCDWPR